MTVRIEKNVPLPPARTQTPKYPWAELAVGDSMLIAGLSKNGVHPQASRYGRKLGRKFVCRKVTGGVRVWRTA